MEGRKMEGRVKKGEKKGRKKEKGRKVVEGNKSKPSDSKNRRSHGPALPVCEHT